MSEEITIKIKKENIWMYTTFILAAILIIGAIMYWNNPSKGQTTNTAQQAAAQQQQQQAAATTATVDFSKLIGANTPVTGSKTAPVTVVEFADFSCPWCAAASGDNPAIEAAARQQVGAGWDPIISNLMKDYVASGKVRLAFKYTMGHTGGHPAHLVSWCLNDQSSALFWKFYPQAFANQQDVENLTKMIALAKTVGADMTKLQTCLDSKKYDSRFDQEQSESGSLGIRGTPGFLVGKSGGNTATIVAGADAYSNFKQLVDSMMQ